MTELIRILAQWFLIKSGLHLKSRSIFYKQNEIWWCSVGFNIGQETYGKGQNFTRPILVFKKISSNLFFGIPLTSRVKDGSWYVKITVRGATNCVMLHQARVFDARRLRSRLISLDREQIEKIKKSFFEFYLR